MSQGTNERASHCHACGKPAAGDGERCIFCGAGLMRVAVSSWRGVYHPYSYADALLASATLQAHGLTARLRHGSIERVLLGNVGGVVEVAEGEHLMAQEVLRQLRGVRTDTEYLEWQALKQRPRRRQRLLLGALAAAAATAVAAGLFWGLSDDAHSRFEPAREQARR